MRTTAGTDGARDRSVINDPNILYTIPVDRFFSYSDFKTIQKLQ